MSEKTTDEQLIKLTANKLAYLIFAVVIATNTVSLTVQKVNNNSEKHQYLDDATKRRLYHSEIEQEYKHKIAELETDLKLAEFRLDECQEDIQEEKDKK
jgi:hypothetical protein